MNKDFIEEAIEVISYEFAHGDNYWSKSIFYLTNENNDKRKYKNKINGYKMRRNDLKNAIIILVNKHNLINKNDIINYIKELKNKLINILNNSEVSLWFYISNYEPRLKYTTFKKKLDNLKVIYKDNLFLLILFTTYQWVNC